MNRQVVYARLHTEAYLPSVGALGTIFPTPSKVLEQLSMTVTSDFLCISFIFKGNYKEILIPNTNVCIMELAREE